MIHTIGTWSNVNYSYDDETLEYIVNPNGDSLGLIALGLNNTRITQAAFSALHDGNDIFTGRADYIGHWAAFPFTTNMYGTITDFARIKKYVDRDPVVTLDPTCLTTLAEVDLLDNPDNPNEVYYDAPFIVDEGYGYEQTGLTYRWFFEKGTYGTIQQTITFTDAESNKTIPTGRSTTTAPIDIEFVDGLTELIVPKMISESTFAFQIFDAEPTKVYDVKNKVYSNVTGTMTFYAPENPTYSDPTIVGDMGATYNDPKGSRCANMASTAQGVWLEGTENIMRVGTSWAVSFWFPPATTGSGTVLAKHGGAAFTDWAEIQISTNAVSAYFGGITISAGTGSRVYNNCCIISCEYTTGNSYTINAWMNNTKTITNSVRTITGLRDLVRRVALFARTVDDTAGSAFTNTLKDRPITNVVIYDHAITDNKAKQIYRNQDNSIIIGVSGDSNAGMAVASYGYITNLVARYRTMGYPIRALSVAMAGHTSYDFGPSTLVKAPWLAGYSEVRPDVDPLISSDRLINEYGCDVLVPAESSNFSLYSYLWQADDTGDASSAEYVYNIGQYNIQAEANNIKMYPLGCLPVNSTALKRNVPWCDVQVNCYNDAKTLYTKTMDTMTWAIDSGTNLPLPLYTGDVQHPSEAYHPALVTNGIAPVFDPVGLKLLQELYPSLEIFKPVILPKNIINGDYIEYVAGDIVEFTYNVFNGDTYGNELVSENKTLVTGSNTVTLSFTDQWGNIGTQALTVKYGPSLNAVIGDWTMDAITPSTYLVDDSTTFLNDFVVYALNDTNRNTITISGGKMVFPATTVAKLKTVNNSSLWFPFAQNYGFMGWINFADVTTMQIIFGRGGAGARRAFGVQSGRLLLNIGGNNASITNIGSVVSTGIRYHLAVQLRYDATATKNTKYVWDLYINGALDATLDIDMFENPIFQKASFGGLDTNSTVDTNSTGLPLNATVDHWKYRNNLWTAQEISDIYTAEL